MSCIPQHCPYKCCVKSGDSSKKMKCGTEAACQTESIFTKFFIIPITIIIFVLILIFAAVFLHKHRPQPSGY